MNTVGKISFLKTMNLIYAILSILMIFGFVFYFIFAHDAVDELSYSLNLDISPIINFVFFYIGIAILFQLLLFRNLFILNQLSISISPDTVNIQEQNDSDSDILIKKDYHQNGNLKSIIRFKDNKKHGLAEYYYEDGNLDWKVKFLNGEIIDQGNHL